MWPRSLLPPRKKEEEEEEEETPDRINFFERRRRVEVFCLLFLSLLLPESVSLLLL